MLMVKLTFNSKEVTNVFTPSGYSKLGNSVEMRSVGNSEVRLESAASKVKAASEASKSGPSSQKPTGRIQSFCKSVFKKKQQVKNL